MKNKLVKFFLAALGLAVVLPTLFSMNTYAEIITETCVYRHKDEEGYWSVSHDSCSESESNKTRQYDTTTRQPVSSSNSGTSTTTNFSGNLADITSDKDLNSLCYDSKIDGVAWIVCPTLNNSVSFADKMMDFVEPMLTIDARSYNNASAAYTAWQAVLGLANIAMIIVLLIVIFSQVTGVGIDNYGIKKILPRLIVMAVLVNLSFFVCQIAIDLSNILGASLNGLFQSLASTVNISGEKVGVIRHIITALFALAAGAGTITTAVMTGIAIFQGGGFIALILMALLLLLIALAAVTLFFLALCLRMMIIIVMTAAAPLAFAAYILPNTQQYFKKWWNTFKAALLVYPICGALFGLSKVIQNLALNTSGDAVQMFFMGLLAVVAPYIPFFLLPSLLKGAIAATGALGAAAIGLGSKWRSGVSNTSKVTQNAAGVTRAAETGRAKMDYDRAVRKHAELSQRLAAGKRLSVMQQQELNDAQAKITSYRKQEANALSGAPVYSSDYYQNTAQNTAVNIRAVDGVGVATISQDVANIRASGSKFGQEYKMWSDQFSGQSPNAVRKAFADSLKDGDSAKMAAAYSTLHSMKQFEKIYQTLDGRITEEDGSHAIDGFNWNSAQADVLRGYMGGSSEVIFKTFSKTGGADQNVSFADYMQGGTSIKGGQSVGATLIQSIANAKGLGNQDKDTIRQLQSINQPVSGSDADTLAKMVVSNLASNSNKPEDKEAFRGLIDKIGANNQEFINSFSSAINGASLAGMSMADFDKISAKVGEAEAFNIVSKAWSQATAPGNARLLAGMDNNLRNHLEARLGRNNPQNPNGPSNNNGPNNGGLPITH